VVILTSVSSVSKREVNIVVNSPIQPP